MKMEEMLREKLGKEIAQVGDEEIYVALLEIVQGLAKDNLSVTADAVPPPLPRGGFGRPQSFPSQFKVFLSARGSPFGGAGGRKPD